ncbi:hypothetical protein FNYG_10125 [Fusarium nygamai]|uniref:Uncharacterized protein n=1 Tax=Gibberella nygamai TaxID=42673 RepID=A0A2K0W367_GIBNY|nr:hypothetical protein FNYG_10125 [Fusarium nygamai]
MKRVEASKEAARNLVVIDPDGSTEWQEVHLTPANWATLCKEKVDQWQEQNNRLSRKDFESEIKRLNRLLLSYTGLKESIETETPKGQAATGGTPGGSGTDQAITNGNEAENDKAVAKGDAKTDKKPTLTETEAKLTEAYKGLYDAQNAIPPNPLTTREKQNALQTALDNNSKANLENNKDVALGLSNKSKTEKVQWINSMITDVTKQLELLKAGLEAFYKASAAAPAITEVVKKDVKEPGQAAKGELVSTQYAEADDQYADPTSNATSNCAVDIKFEALLVTIDRAWLHGELFSDPELNTGDDVKLSPGALDLHKLIDQKNDKALANYPYFPSYPTAFIVASNVELEFRGDTTSLEEAVESSHTDAQVKVGYGPFSLSASHSQDKSSAKTKMETTATGTRITLEAPAIIGWVSQLVPQLPRPKGGSSLVGPMV